MICAIMQPTFFPWAGYLNLMHEVDVFIYLDDVQFDRRSWQCRNRVFDGGKAAWLTCPTVKASRETLLKDIQIAYHEDWQGKHEKKLHLNYANSKCYSDILPLSELAYRNSFSKLIEMNVSLIEKIKTMLGIDTKTMYSSELNSSGKRSEKLLNLCRAVGADEYLSPQGSKQYLIEDDVFDSSEVKLHFQSFSPAPYKQLHTDDFVSHLSILDVISNIGVENTKKYVEDKYVA